MAVAGSANPAALPNAWSTNRAATLFHLTATSLVVALNIGAYVDARAHIHDGFNIHSFFVPSHFGLHGAWLGMCALLFVYALRSRGAGLPLRRWLPAGYGVTALGALTWGIAGGFDLGWHSLFGFEVNVETVYTPSHLTLLASSALMTLGVIRHSLHERSRPGGAGAVAVEVPLVIGNRGAVEGGDVAHPIATKGTEPARNTSDTQRPRTTPSAASSAAAPAIARTKAQAVSCGYMNA